MYHLLQAPVTTRRRWSVEELRTVWEFADDPTRRFKEMTEFVRERLPARSAGAAWVQVKIRREKK